MATKSIPRVTGGGGSGSSFTNLIGRGIAGLGSMAGQAINAYTGAVSRGVSSLGSAAGSGLGSLVRGDVGRSIAGLGQSGNNFTTVIPGSPQSQQQRQTYGGNQQANSYFDSWGSPGLPPRRPDPPSGSAGAGGGGGGGGGGTVRSEMNAWMEKARLRQGNEANVGAYNKAFAEAKLGNETRYQQMLSIADSTTNQRAKDIGIDYAGRESDAMQGLQRLGMGNTTIAPTMGMGFGRQKNAALDRLADQMQGTKLGIIERRTDAYPDLASLVSLGKLGISGLKF